MDKKVETKVDVSGFLAVCKELAEKIKDRRLMISEEVTFYDGEARPTLAISKMVTIEKA